MAELLHRIIYDDYLEEFLNVLIRRRIERIQHFEIWNDLEFYKRFRMTKETCMAVLQKIEHLLEYPTDRYRPAANHL